MENKQMEWISVEDRLPAHRDKILITDGKLMATIDIDMESGDERKWLDPFGFNGHAFECFIEWADVTHWMPLPEPPKA